MTFDAVLIHIVRVSRVAGERDEEAHHTDEDAQHKVSHILPLGLEERKEPVCPSTLDKALPGWIRLWKQRHRPTP
jgi:hypothetical protein